MSTIKKMTSLPFFCGEFNHSLDNQNRLAIPSQWRSGDGDEFVLFPGEEFIMLLPMQSFQDFLKKISKVSIADRKAQLALAQIGAKVQQCKCDKQGRIKITGQILGEADIDYSVVMVGSFTNIQLWNPVRWEEINDISKDSLQQVEKISNTSSSVLDNFQSLLEKLTD
ncbi:hypothetical protein AAEX28_11885 [Lentisphaerota bacterium WC36G]|nr:hypothetical protein LJT99_14720 [Lentisphaerae bacterium WC36]